MLLLLLMLLVMLLLLPWLVHIADCIMSASIVAFSSMACAMADMQLVGMLTDASAFIAELHVALMGCQPSHNMHSSEVQLTRQPMAQVDFCPFSLSAYKKYEQGATSPYHQQA